MTPAGFFRLLTQDVRGEKPGVDRRQRRQARQSTRDHPGGPSRAPATLLLIDPDNPAQLTARSRRRWVTLVARLLASTFDRHLAEGRTPESHRLLAARAQVLVSPVVRSDLVDRWENLLVQAHRPPVMRDPRVPFNRQAIIECEPDIREMLDALLVTEPVPARGPAMASWLLRDGTGPIYNRHRSGDLRTVLRETITQLDASVRL